LSLEVEQMPLRGGRGDRGRDGAEGLLQVGAETLNDGDDGDRDAGGDQAVFCCGRSGLILGKALYEVRHFKLHWSTRGCLSVIPEPVLSWLIRKRRRPYRCTCCGGVNLRRETRRFRAINQCS